MQATAHPDHELAGIFPLLEGAELQALAADIGAHGLREPVVLLEGAILDGRNRYRACQIAGVQPRFEVYTGDDPISLVVSLNLHRRHLSESQRAMVAARLANLAVGSNQHVSRLTHDPVSGEVFDPPREVASANWRKPTADQAAGMLNVGTRSIERARTVQTQGEPEIVRAVERGAISVSAAAEVVKLPPDAQREVAARPKLPTAAQARKQAKEKGVSVPARDGNTYNGRTKEEERADTEAGDRASLVLRPFRTLSAIDMTPDDAFQALDLPKFGRVLGPELDELWPKVWSWLERFNAIWRAHQAQ